MIYHRRYKMKRKSSRWGQRNFSSIVFFTICSSKLTDATSLTDTKKKRASHTNASQTADRSTTVNFKELPRKTRRATTVSDLPKVSSTWPMIEMNNHPLSSHQNHRVIQRQKHYLHYEDSNPINRQHQIYWMKRLKLHLLLVVTGGIHFSDLFVW